MEKFQAGKPIITDNYTIVPVARFIIRTAECTSSYWFSTQKEAYAAIFYNTKGIRVLSISGNEISLEHLIVEVPGLKTIIKSLTE